MKFLFLASYLAASASALVQGYTFQHYLKEFGKEYGESEHGLREAHFQRSLEKVLAHNARNDTSYKMGINQFSDMSDAERASYRAGKRSMAIDTDPAFGYLEPSAEWMEKVVPVSELPDSVDWRSKGVTTPVKDQGNCGSCWAFSATEVLESHVAIASGKLLELSPQQLVSCSPNPDECGGTGGCSGSTQWLAFNYTVAAGGLSLDKDYPYHQMTLKCNPDKIVPAAGIKDYVRLPTNNYTVLMNAVATLGPVAISLAADFMSYGTGIFDGECGYDIDHAVVLEGYGPGYYLVRNSWGKYWGEDGYIRIARHDDDSTRCGTDRHPADGTSCKPYPSEMEVCGLCGILSDSSYPTGAFIPSSEISETK